MGCIPSSPNLFSLKKDDVFSVRVLRVQSESVILAGQGVLELTPHELVFIAPNQEPVAWALQHLRRYGLTENVFSFEAGRRCTTGPGIYTFRCSSNADQLYSRFQWYINAMSVGSERDRYNTSIHPSNLFERVDPHQHQNANQYLEPTSMAASVEQRAFLDGLLTDNETNLNSPDSMLSPSLTSEIVHIPAASYSNVHSTSSNYNIYMEQPIIASNANEHNNATSAADLILKTMIRSSLDIPPTDCAPMLSSKSSDSCAIDPATLPQPSICQANTSGSDLEPTYANVDLHNAGLAHTSQNNSQSHSSPDRISPAPSGNVVNYIVLDLDQPRSPSQCSPKAMFGSGLSLISRGNEFCKNEEVDALSLSCGSSTMPKRTTTGDVKSKYSDTMIESTGSYTRIDFLKTFALMKSSANYADFDPEHDQEESRITRHSKFIRKAYSISE